jgi:hypothetical protein
MAAERVKRLRDLMDMLERLPESADRDRILSEVRSRAVDVDTGVTPRAMLPMREPTPPPTVTRPAKVDRAPSVQRPAPAPVPEPVRPVFAATPVRDPEHVLWLDDRITLDDEPLPHLRAKGAGADRPWTLGLRA